MILKNLDIKDVKEFKGENIIDLAEPTLIIKRDSPNFRVTRYFYVTDDYAMRPDLISFAIYGSVDYVDILLKANEISNPFSIDTGDILLVIDKDAAQSFYKKPVKKKTIVDAIKSLFINPDRASKKDKSRLEKLKKQASKKTNGALPLTTNRLAPGDENLTFNNGTIRITDQKSKK